MDPEPPARIPVDLDGLFAETALAGVCLIQDALFRYVNPAFARLFDYPREELIGRLGPADLLRPEHRPWIEESRRRLLEGHELSVSQEVGALTRGGRPLDVEVLAVVVPYQGRPAVLATLLDITERKRAEREASEKRAEVEALYRAASRLLGSMEMETLAREVVAAADQEFGKGHLSLFLLDVEGRTLRQVACSQPELNRGFVFPLDGPGLTVLAARTGEIVHVADVSRDPRYIRGSAPPGAELAIPLAIGERVLGVLNFESQVKGAFSGRDILVLKAFADRAASALDTARLHEHLQERTRQLERFHELALTMVGDAASIHRAIVGQVQELLRAPYAFIVRVEGDLIRSVAVGSPSPADQPGASFPIDLTPCRVIRDGRESRIFRNIPEEFPEDSYLRELGIRTYIGVPLFDRRGEVAGILNAMDPRDRVFGPEELRILNLLGRRAAEELEEERHQREKESTERMLLQSEKMASLGQVVAGVAHELNNPLASVLGYAELLSRREDLPASARASLETIVGEAERARRVVKNLLAFAREHAPERATASLNEVVARTLALRENEMRVSGIETVRDLAADLPSTLADAHLLQQAFLNLVLNAEQAMRDARGRGRLTVRTRFRREGGSLRPGPTLRVEFEDDGPGIPEASLRKVFEPFFTTKDVGKGTGLGLSLTHSIVEQHGGAVWVENVPGAGARFIIELPHLRPPEEEAAPAGVAAAPRTGLRGRRVLVAEDEDSLREIVREVLEGEGCQVVEAADGRAALEQLAAQTFDLVISDVKMPDVGGLEVYRRACGSNPALAGRFLFVTGDWVSDDTARFLQQTGCAHLEKPYNVDQLVRRLEELLP